MTRVAFDVAAIYERIARERRVLIVVAGPNGAGKSTFFNEIIKPSFCVS